MRPLQRKDGGGSYRKLYSYHMVVNILRFNTVGTSRSVVARWGGNWIVSKILLVSHSGKCTPVRASRKKEAF